MKKRRPSAADREIAEAIQSMPEGTYTLTIGRYDAQSRFLSQASLKQEDTMVFVMPTGQMLTIAPVSRDT